jgi:hypothetical protein
LRLRPVLPETLRWTLVVRNAVLAALLLPSWSTGPVALSVLSGVGGTRFFLLYLLLNALRRCRPGARPPFYLKRTCHADRPDRFPDFPDRHPGVGIALLAHRGKSASCMRVAGGRVADGQAGGRELAPVLDVTTMDGAPSIGKRWPWSACSFAVRVASCLLCKVDPNRQELRLPRKIGHRLYRR